MNISWMKYGNFLHTLKKYCLIFWPMNIWHLQRVFFKSDILEFTNVSIY